MSATTATRRPVKATKATTTATGRNGRTTPRKATKTIPHKAKTPAKATTPAKVTATRTKRPRRGEARHGPYALMETDEFGFAKGTDVAILIEQMVAGGYDRKDIIAKVRATLMDVMGGDITTRSGRQKNLPSLMSMLLAELHQDGYEVMSWWQLIPPDDIKAKLSKPTRAQMTKVERVIGRRPIR